MMGTTEATESELGQTGDLVSPSSVTTTAHMPRRLRAERRHADRRLRRRLRRWAAETRFYYAPDESNVPASSELRQFGYGRAMVCIGPLMPHEDAWIDQLVDGAVRETSDAAMDIRLEAAQEHLRRAVPAEREARRLVAENRAERATECLDSREADGASVVGVPFAAGKRTALEAEAAAAGLHRMVSHRKSAGGRYGSE